MTMGRVHRRDPRGDWSLELDLPDHFVSVVSSSAVWLPAGRPRYSLSLRLTREQAVALLDESNGTNRGCPHFQHGTGMMMQVSGIELTPDEVDLVAHGTHPLDVLFPVWPEYGYRLVAVPVRLSELPGKKS